MKNYVKKAMYAGLAGAAISGALVLINNMIQKRNYEEWDEQRHEHWMEMSMGAGSMEVEDESGYEWAEETAEEVSEAEPEDDEEDTTEFVSAAEEAAELAAEAPAEEPVDEPLRVVGVRLTGPRTARVRPTEEEEREKLREKLEKMIRF